VIFVTVGSQLPFDRLVLAADRWAAARGREDLFAQIGIGATPPQHMDSEETLTPQAFLERLHEAQLVVAHAGCGSILQALSLGKRILVMPRRGDLRETRNDHQMATAARMQELCGVPVAHDESELIAQLDQLSDATTTTVPTLRESASEELLETIRRFIVGLP